jgi:TonB family protein
MNDMQQRAFLAHEQAHVRGRHTVDVLLAETVCILFWFHPLAYWYRRTLRQVHEYIADAAASRQLTRKQYGLLLIQQSYPGNMPALAHSFYQSPLQQRLIMLTKQHSPTIQGCKYLFILPLCVLCIWCCQKREDFTEKGASDGVERAAALPSASDHALELYQIQQLPEFEGGMTALMRYLGEHIQYPQEARAKKIEGKAAIQFIVEKDGSISQVEILKDVAGGCGAEAARVVASMPRWKPGLLEGRPVRVRYTLPVRFRLE